MSEYFDELCRAMKLLADHPKSVFMGQAVACDGTAMFRTLRDVPMEKRVELPVFEDTQMGMAIGAALGGFLPITIYPRWNFLLLAASQLVLHLDKLPFMSMGGYRPVVIIRTAVATDEPLNPGPQHLGDYSEPFKRMLQTVSVVELYDHKEIVPAYTKAAVSKRPTLLVERMEFY